MDLTLVTELIATLGFPLTAVLVMAWFIYKIYKKSEQREDVLHQEIQECREINKEAISTIAKYAEKLEVIQADVNDIKNDVIRISEHMV